MKKLLLLSLVALSGSQLAAISAEGQAEMQRHSAKIAQKHAEIRRLNKEVEHLERTKAQRETQLHGEWAESQSGPARAA